MGTKKVKRIPSLSISTTSTRYISPVRSMSSLCCRSDKALSLRSVNLVRDPLLYRWVHSSKRRHHKQALYRENNENHSAMPFLWNTGHSVYIQSSNLSQTIWNINTLCSISAIRSMPSTSRRNLKTSSLRSVNLERNPYLYCSNHSLRHRLDGTPVTLCSISLVRSKPSPSRRNHRTSPLRLVNPDRQNTE